MGRNRVQKVIPPPARGRVIQPTARKKEKLSLSALLSMDQKPDKPNISKLAKLSLNFPPLLFLVELQWRLQEEDLVGLEEEGAVIVEAEEGAEVAVAEAE
ncbi:unnamed protein product [Linum trigynum]|uniref:Uncharacterized protein n=1 Tax=Linum trigynum TaxID=586398 RepID=A0AAV2CV42_9ROSI